MADRVSSERRSAIMSKVGTRNTGPEMAIRKAIHRMGYRYVLHDKRLPGAPDLVFPRRRKVIFVHGCFWHGHGCRWGRLPKSNLPYWEPKITANAIRDSRRLAELSELGWRTLVVWQCELKDMAAAIARITEFLESDT